MGVSRRRTRCGRGAAPKVPKQYSAIMLVECGVTFDLRLYGHNAQGSSFLVEFANIPADCAHYSGVAIAVTD
jgi:hypothetical protein